MILTVRGSYLDAYPTPRLQRAPQNNCVGHSKASKIPIRHFLRFLGCLAHWQSLSGKQLRRMRCSVSRRNTHGRLLWGSLQGAEAQQEIQLKLLLYRAIRACIYTFYSAAHGPKCPLLHTVSIVFYYYK